MPTSASSEGPVDPPAGRERPAAERVQKLVPIVVLLALALLLGVWMPQPLESALWAAAALVEGRS